MKTLKKDNIILREKDEGKIKELKVQGFMEIDKDGKVIGEQSVETVPLADFEVLQDENEDLKGQLEAADASKAELEKLQTELDKFKAENKDLKAKVKELEKK